VRDLEELILNDELFVVVRDVTFLEEFSRILLERRRQAAGFKDMLCVGYDTVETFLDVRDPDIMLAEVLAS